MDLVLLPEKRFGLFQVTGFNTAYFEYLKRGGMTANRCTFLTFAQGRLKQPGEAIEASSGTEPDAWDVFDDLFPKFLEEYFPGGGDTLCWRMEPQLVQDEANNLFYVRARVYVLDWAQIDTFLVPNWINLPEVKFAVERERTVISGGFANG